MACDVHGLRQCASVLLVLACVCACLIPLDMFIVSRAIETLEPFEVATLVVAIDALSVGTLLVVVKAIAAMREGLRLWRLCAARVAFVLVSDECAREKRVDAQLSWARWRRRRPRPGLPTASEWWGVSGHDHMMCPSHVVINDWHHVSGGLYEIDGTGCDTHSFRFTGYLNRNAKTGEIRLAWAQRRKADVGNDALVEYRAFVDPDKSATAMFGHWHVSADLGHPGDLERDSFMLSSYPPPQWVRGLVPRDPALTPTL